MVKARRPVQRRTRPTSRQRQESGISRLLSQRVLLPALVVLILGLAVGLVVFLASRSGSPRQTTAPAQAPQQAPAVSQPTAVLVGQGAPPFTLSAASGEAYSLKPGDGKNHLLLFYMGYF